MDRLLECYMRRGSEIAVPKKVVWLSERVIPGQERDARDWTPIRHLEDVTVEDALGSFVKARCQQRLMFRMRLPR